MVNNLFVYGNGEELTFNDYYSNAQACVVEAGYDLKKDKDRVTRAIVFLTLASAVVSGRPVPDVKKYAHMIKFVLDYYLDKERIERLTAFLHESYVSSGVLLLENNPMTPDEFDVYQNTVWFFHIRDTEYSPRAIKRVANTNMWAAKDRVLKFYENTKKKSKAEPDRKINESDVLSSPHILSSYLKQYVIGQDAVVDAFSNIAFQYYSYVRRGKLPAGMHYNVLLVGESGCGKTTLMNAFSTIKDVNVKILDCTGVTESGYRGREPKELVDESKFGTTVFYDEIDKIIVPSITADGRDIHQEVQGCFLKTMEDKGGFNVFAGAFPGISDIIAARVNSKYKRVGFSVDENEREIEEAYDVTEEDLLKYGASREFIGRLDYILLCRHLNEVDFYNILKKSAYSPIKSKTLVAKDCYKIHLELSEKCYKELATMAVKHEVGARALGQYINSVLDPLLADAFDKGKERIKISGFNKKKSRTSSVIKA